MVIWNFGISGFKEKTKEQLEKKFSSLNKKYVSLDKKMSKLARQGVDTFEIEVELDKIQSQMSLISNELERKF